MKDSLDKLLKKYLVQPVGKGYIDCIVTKENVTGFVESLSEMGIKITNLTWWCHYTENNKNEYDCPHGMGGPKSEYFDGYFSEMCDGPFDAGFKCNEDVVTYIFCEALNEKWYSPCLVPALWLDVPDSWKNALL